MPRAALLCGALLCAALLLAACVARRPEIPSRHVVRAGETLYSISMRYGLDFEDVARWNGIGRDYLVRPGQSLRLDPPPLGAGGATRARQPEVAAAPLGRASPDDPKHRPPAWQWPVEGGRVRGAVRQPSGGVGLRIDGELNQPVHAAADGRVVYTGSGLRGYGQLVIINHARGWLTAYGHNASVQVREGQAVRAGQPIAAMGTGTNQQPMLYFEIRLDGAPQDPLEHLPAR
ncbi:MAG: peptidoglycan DD-metalloendopeptidase family protein [Gammaproteobacteria bacterium]